MAEQERDFTLIVLYRENDILRETPPIRVFAKTPEAAAFKAIGEKLVTHGRPELLRARAWHLGKGPRPDMSLLFMQGEAPEEKLRENEPMADIGAENLRPHERFNIANGVEHERDA